MVDLAAGAVQIAQINVEGVREGGKIVVFGLKMRIGRLACGKRPPFLAEKRGLVFWKRLKTFENL